jgi:hypothetical protein
MRKEVDEDIDLEEVIASILCDDEPVNKDALVKRNKGGRSEGSHDEG